MGIIISALLEIILTLLIIGTIFALFVFMWMTVILLNDKSNEGR